MMGIAPGVKTEFWYWSESDGIGDFCADLKHWTSTILRAWFPPSVHSMSYGWGKDLAQIGCDPNKFKDIEDDFAKLATRGITIVVSSGDDGANYKEPEQSELCGPKSVVPDVAVQGELLRNVTLVLTPWDSDGPARCCNEATSGRGAYLSWTYVPPAKDETAVPHLECPSKAGTAFTGQFLRNVDAWEEVDCCHQASEQGLEARAYT